MLNLESCREREWHKANKNGEHIANTEYYCCIYYCYHIVLVFYCCRTNSHKHSGLKHIHLPSHSFPGSDVLRVSWVLCSTSYQAVIKVSAWAVRLRLLFQAHWLLAQCCAVVGLRPPVPGAPSLTHGLLHNRVVFFFKTNRRVSLVLFFSFLICRPTFIGLTWLGQVHLRQDPLLINLKSTGWKP